MIQIRKGDRVTLVSLMFISYDLRDNTALMRRGSGGDVILPLSLSEFDLGQYGVNSRVFPTNLPFTHPDFCTWRDESKRKVRHTRTGENCTITVGENFYSVGEYRLIPEGGSEGKTRIAPTWTTVQLRSHLESLKGKEMEIVLRIVGIVFDDRLVDSVILSKVNRARISLYVSTTKWETFFHLPLNLFKLEEAKNQHNPYFK